MASEGQQKLDYGLVQVDTLTLETTDERSFYTFIVVCNDKIIVIDGIVWKVRIYRLSDGKFLATSLRLESVPRDMCLMNAMEICLIHGNGLIKMMSIDYTDISRVLTTTRTVRLQGVMDKYLGVVRFNNNLVVSGVKQGRMYWCIVSLDDGQVDTIQQICKGDRWNYMTTKDTTIYISCYAGVDSLDNTGVYKFDILNPSQCKYTYKHQCLQKPRSIVINEDGCIFVSNHGFQYEECIHQLTASCQLVAIFAQETLSGIQAIFWNQGRLYVTRYMSCDITIFKPVSQGNSHFLYLTDITNFNDIINIMTTLI